MSTLVFVTQEPHGSYHLAPLLQLPHKLIHLQPAPVIRPTDMPQLAVTDDWRVLESADLLIATGGLTTPFTEAVMGRAAQLGCRVLFLELAYPKNEWSAPSPAHPHLVAATTPGGLQTYRKYLPNAGDYALVRHPALVNLPDRKPAAEPLILLGTSVSAELPDGGATLRAYAHMLARRDDVQLRVRLHPREGPELWRGLPLSPKIPLTEDLLDAWAFIAYPTTAFLTSEAMGIPSHYLADKAWMGQLLPSGYSQAQPLQLTQLASFTPSGKGVPQPDRGAILQLRQLLDGRLVR